MAPLPAVWTSLALDGQPRVFQVFPNGESSLLDISQYLHGDYIGLQEENIIHLWLYIWPTQEKKAGRTCYVVKITLNFCQVAKMAVEMLIQSIDEDLRRSEYLDFDVHSRISTLKGKRPRKLMQISSCYYQHDVS